MGRALAWTLPAVGVIGGTAVGLVVAAVIGSTGSLRPLGMLAYLVVVVLMFAGAGGGMAIGLRLAAAATRPKQ